MSRNFIWPLASSLIGILIGFLLPNPWNDKSPGYSVSSPDSGSKRERNASGDWDDMRPDRPGRGTKSERTASNDEPGEEAEERHVLVPLALLEELGAASGSRVTGESIFSDSLVERLLDVTDLEKARIQTEWKKVRKALKVAEVSEMRSEQKEDGSVTILLPSVPSGFAELGESFGEEVRAVMGKERGDTFLALKQLDRLFEPGEGERTYLVKPEATGDGGWRFHMTVEGPKGRKVWVSETIPDEISHLTDAAGIRRSLAEE